MANTMRMTGRMTARMTGMVAFLAISGIGAPGLAQTTANMKVAPAVSGGGGAAVVRVPDANDPIVRAYAAQQKRRTGMDRELKKIRFTYFRSGHNTELRQAGIAKLRAYDDPAAFPSLLAVFRDEGADVRTAILDQLASYTTDEADATLAWTAVFDQEKDVRDGALQRLAERCRQAGSVSRRVQSVVAEGLSRSNETQIASAAGVADVLNLYEAIPMLIAGQVVGGSPGGASGGEGNGDGALAYILVGQQRAFVANLRPVVGDNAVAFDPTLGVVTDGVFLRVIDASVVTYRSDVHNALLRLSGRGWGRPTDGLGWDQRRWQDWYAREFLPARAEAARAEAEAAEAAKAGAGAAAPTVGG